MKKIIEINQASFGYGSGKARNKIVSNISLCVSKGEFILLVGPNGCGKSTIIRGILNLVSCFSGSVKWHIPMCEIGYIPQEPNIDYDIPATALDLVCTSRPFSWSGSRDSGMKALEIVGMQEHAGMRFGAMSGGQKRRVLLARALFGNPTILILDEPTVNTDRETEKNMENVLTKLCSKGEVGILATTHSEKWAGSAKRCYVTLEGLNDE